MKLLTVAAMTVLATTASGGVAMTQPIGDLFLTSAIHLDRASGDITLPLYEGRHAGAPVWYIVTESSNQEQAERLGVNFAPKLANALGTAAVQNVRLVNAQTGRPSPARPSLKSRGVVLEFDGTVDFSPERIVVPGPTGFPPVQFQAGAVGDSNYSPLRVRAETSCSNVLSLAL